jgi:hypothetical protein
LRSAKPEVIDDELATEAVERVAEVGASQLDRHRRLGVPGAEPCRDQDGRDGRGEVKVVKIVLAALDKARHVRPIIYLDSELQHVPEEHARGIGVYREKLGKLLGDRPVSPIHHEEIIAKLDQAGATFHILILKTKMTLPYTSVFIQLDCGYWSAKAEQELRAAMKAAS